MKKTILIMVDWFVPGYKAGGPISACYNLAMLLKSDYNICIFTSDRDLNDKSAYDGILVNSWIPFNKDISVYYASPEQLNWKNIERQIRLISPSCIYLNSMFSLQFTLIPLLLKMMRRLKARVVLAPRGMLKDTALASKSMKKNAFLTLFKLLPIRNKIFFHATDEAEKNDIKKVFGRRVRITRVLDVPPAPASVVVPARKRKGAMKLLFVGRIHPIKNLHFLLTVLKRFQGALALTIVGPVENKEYYDHCKRLAGDLPPNIYVNFEGEAPHSVIKDWMVHHHFLALPTLGENYGHVIVESFCLGRPVIISNRTPWRDLAGKKMGWDISLDREGDLLEVLNRAADMEQNEFTEWCESSLEFARRLSAPSIYRKKYGLLFGDRYGNEKTPVFPLSEDQEKRNQYEYEEEAGYAL